MSASSSQADQAPGTTPESLEHAWVNPAFNERKKFFESIAATPATPSKIADIPSVHAKIRPHENELTVNPVNSNDNVSSAQSPSIISEQEHTRLQEQVRSLESKLNSLEQSVCQREAQVAALTKFVNQILEAGKVLPEVYSQAQSLNQQLGLTLATETVLTITEGDADNDNDNDNDDDDIDNDIDGVTESMNMSLNVSASGSGSEGSTNADSGVTIATHRASLRTPSIPENSALQSSADDLSSSIDSGATSSDDGGPERPDALKKRSDSATICAPAQRALNDEERRKVRSLDLGMSDRRVRLEAMIQKHQLQQEIMKSASFSVTKKNKFGKMQARVLELDFVEHCIRNIDPESGKVIKKLEGSSLLQIEKDDKDKKLLRIYFQGGDQRPYKIYFSCADDRESFVGKMISLRTMSATTLTPDGSQVSMGIPQQVGSKLENISIFIGTWNMGNAAPPDSLSRWIPRETHDIYAIGTQECEYQPRLLHDTRNLAAASEDWGQTLQIHLGPDFVPVAKVSLWAINIIVFIRKCHVPKISNVETGTKPTGIAQVCGNKGGVGVSFKFHETSLCFVNCHLAARPERLSERRKNYVEIIRWLRLGLKSFDITNQFHYMFWFGDLNYRIDLPYNEVLSLLAEKRYSDVFAHDQLTRESLNNHSFVAFKEGEYNFAPTYRYNRGTRTYSNKKMQSPSWCDRILWRTLPGLSIEQTSLGSSTSVLTSDHLPVYATFSLPTHRYIQVNSPDQPCCLITVKSVKCQLQPPKKVKRPCPYVMFHANFLENPGQSVPIPDSMDPQWEESQLPRMYPFISDREYLVHQHLLISVLDQNSAFPIGQGAIALEEACNEKPVKFECQLVLDGKLRGSMSGLFEMKWLDPSWNRQRMGRSMDTN